MSERAIENTHHTITAYERLHGVPEQVSEGIRWAREGFVTVDILQQFAEGLGRHNAPDIARYALRAVARDREYLKFLQERTYERLEARQLSDAQRFVARQAIEAMQVPHHLAEVEVLHRPSEFGGVVQTRAQFFDNGGDKDLLDRMNEWMVPIDSIQRVYPQLQDNLGVFFTPAGEAVRPPIHRYGEDELKVLQYASFLRAK